jgi:hypothetical protein
MLPSSYTYKLFNSTYIPTCIYLPTINYLLTKYLHTYLSTYLLSTTILPTYLPIYLIIGTYVPTYVPSIYTRRNLVLFHPHTLQLLSNLTTFQLHLTIFSLQVIWCTN